MNKEETPQDKQAYARELAINLVHHPCRVPIVFRIQAAHFLVDTNQSTSKEELLGLAWKWCHELQTTALVLSLMNTTQRLWMLNMGSLETLPSLGHRSRHSDQYNVVHATCIV